MNGFMRQHQVSRRRFLEGSVEFWSIHAAYWRDRGDAAKMEACERDRDAAIAEMKRLAH